MWPAASVACPATPWNHTGQGPAAAAVLQRVPAMLVLAHAQGHPVHPCHGVVLGSLLVHKATDDTMCHCWGDTSLPAAVLQGKQLVAVAAAKRHTVVLTASGDVYTWGHRAVTPRRLQLAGGDCTTTAPAVFWPLTGADQGMGRATATTSSTVAADPCSLTQTKSSEQWAGILSAPTVSMQAAWLQVPGTWRALQQGQAPLLAGNWCFTRGRAR